MKIGFFTSLPTLDFRQGGIYSSPDPSPNSLSIPQLSGYLTKHCYNDIRHWELHAEIASYLREHPGTLDWSVFAEQDEVDQYLISGQTQITTIMEFLIELVQVERADLFGISLGLVVGDDLHRYQVVNFALCLLTAMKREYPSCSTVIGGYQRSMMERVRPDYLEMLNRCPALDFAVEGPGEKPLITILRELEGLEADTLGLTRIAGGSGFYLRSWEFDRDRVEIHLPSFEEQGIVPHFQNVDAHYRFTGKQLAERYQLTTASRTALLRYEEQTILPLPLSFVYGCSGKCSFCASSRVPVTFVPVEEVIRRIATLQERHETDTFIFYNTCINHSYDYAWSFATELYKARLNIYWTDSLLLRNLDERLIERLRESGFIRADVGGETASNRLLRHCRKQMNQELMASMFELLHRYGIWNHINLIVGLPGEAVADLRATVEFIGRTHEWVDGFSINRFYLVDVSDFGTRPERYGLQLVAPEYPTANGYRMAYHESDARRWEEVPKWFDRAEDAVVKAVVAAKGHRAQLDGVRFHLLFWLYKSLGWENKARISEIFLDSTGQASGTNSLPDVDAVGPRLNPALATLVQELNGALGKVDFDGYRLTVIKPESRDELRLRFSTGPDMIDIGLKSAAEMPHAFVRGKKYALFFYGQMAENERLKTCERVVRTFLDYLEARDRH